MRTLPVRALVVGDRFITADLFAERLQRNADERGLNISIDTLQLDYPAVDAVPLPDAPEAAVPAALGRSRRSRRPG